MENKDLSSEPSEKEYVLLRNYHQNGITVRGFTLRIFTETLLQIEENSWVEKYSDTDKPVIRGIIQMNVISNLMMYMEDLAVIAEALRTGKNYYEFLDRRAPEDEDLGKIIGDFFKNIDTFSDGDISRIMSYVDPDTLTLDDKQKDLVKRHMQSNIIEIKRMIKQYGDFGKTNHPVFKRFKHAGLPIIPGFVKTSSDGPLGMFDSFILVSKGVDPLEDVVPIPFSKEVWEAYMIIIPGIQTMLQSIVMNRLVCINRKMPGIIPTNSYNAYSFTFEEFETIGKLVETYLNSYPEDTSAKKFNYEPKNSTDEIQWYLQLPTFLATCKAFLEKQEKFDKEFKEHQSKKTES